MPSLGRRIIYTMRSEGAGAARESAAIGLGAFIGCLPIFGLHLAVCIGLGWLLRLNRLKMYLAANISNPLVAPFLLFAELQVGSFLRRGAFHPSASKPSPTDVHFGQTWSSAAMLGAVLGVLLAAHVFSIRASAPTLRSSICASRVGSLPHRFDHCREFARGKLRGDPLRALCAEDCFGTAILLDVGCGSGLMLALLAEARARVRCGTWVSSLPAPPLFQRMIGLDIRPRVVQVAREALKSDAEILEADARDLKPSTHDAVLICDMLHMIAFDEQERVIAAARQSLREGGVLLVREADAAAGWRFRVVLAGNQLKALALRRWRQRFYFRTLTEWRAVFSRHGLEVTSLPNAGGTPFASVLFRLTTAPAVSATRRTPAHAG